MTRYDEHSAWRYYYPQTVRVETPVKKAPSLLSWVAKLIFMLGTLLFVYQIYGWFEHDEWTRYPSIVLVKYLPAGYFSFINKVAIVKDFMLWLLDRADLSVLLILMGYFITKFFVEAE